jgi:hypothetical protein
LIPAGTGLGRYRNMGIKVEGEEEEKENMGENNNAI